MMADGTPQTPQHTYTALLQKPQIDKACKDTKHKLYSPDLAIEFALIKN